MRTPHAEQRAFAKWGGLLESLREKYGVSSSMLRCISGYGRLRGFWRNGREHAVELMILFNNQKLARETLQRVKHPSREGIRPGILGWVSAYLLTRYYYFSG